MVVTKSGRISKPPKRDAVVENLDTYLVDDTCDSDLNFNVDLDATDDIVPANELISTINFNTSQRKLLLFDIICYLSYLAFLL